MAATTSIFSAVDAIFLRRLPIPHAGELASLRNEGKPITVRYRDFRALEAAVGIPPVAGFRFEPAQLRVAEWSDNRFVDLVSGGFFRLLAVRPIRGRLLTDQDDRLRRPVAVISEQFWRTAFGGRADAIGATMLANDLRLTIVGITARDYTGIHFARQFDVAVPASLSPSRYTSVEALPLMLIARLPASSTARGAAAAFNGALQQCCAASPTATFPANPARSVLVTDDAGPTAELGMLYTTAGARGAGIVLTDASHGLNWSVDFRERYRRVLATLLGGVTILLLLTAANVSTLLLARSEARERDLAIHIALGADRGQVALFLWTEAAILTTIAAGCGQLLAVIANPLLDRWLIPAGLNVSPWPSWRVLGAAGAVAAFMTGLVATWPARRAGRTDLVAALSGARLRTRQGWSVDRLLVVAQIALCLILVWAAGLCIATVQNLTGSDGGYGSRNVVIARLRMKNCTSSSVADLHRCFADTNEFSPRLSTFRGIRDVVGFIPGVENAAFALNAPLMQDAIAQRRVRVPGADAPVEVRSNNVTDGFFRATGIGMVAGREFTEQDARGGEPVAVVSESFARTRFGGRSAVGQIIAESNHKSERPVRIVGVAHDASYDRFASKMRDLRNVEREMYYRPLSQAENIPFIATLLVRTGRDPSAAMVAIRRAVDEHSGAQVGELASAGKILDDSSTRERLSARLATAFGAFALALSGLGIYATLSYHVGRRTREFGIRAALGARSADATGVVLRQTAGLLLLGIAVGVPCALVGSRMARTLFYGVAVADWRVMLGAVSLLTMIALAATIIPARRAMAVDPLTALRGS